MQTLAKILAMRKITPLFVAFFIFLLSTTNSSAYFVGSLVEGLNTAIVGCNYDGGTTKEIMCGETTDDSLVMESYMWEKDTLVVDTPQSVSSLDPNSPKQTTSVLGYLGEGIAGVTTNLPASTHVYIADVLHNINPASPAYAQGIGFGSLSPILGIWKVFRNVAYFVMVLIFMIVGFAIMFRAKINPQTVISIENALPQLVITFVLITFSYAIAGLMIDLMYVVIYLLIGIANTYIFTGSSAGLAQPPDVNPAAWALNQNILDNIFIKLGIGAGLPSTGANAIGDLIKQGLGGGVLALAIGGIASAIIYFIILISVMVAAFRTFFSLLMSYINILLSVIFAPLQLLGNAFPGSNAFVKWLKNLAANLMVFPAVIGMLFLALALTGKNTGEGIGYGQLGGGATGFTPPQLGMGSAEAVMGLISIGVVMMLPKVVEAVKGAFGVDEKSGGGGFFGAMAGGAIGAGLAPGLGVMKGITSIPNRATGLINQGASLAQTASTYSEFKKLRSQGGSIKDSAQGALRHHQQATAGRVVDPNSQNPYVTDNQASTNNQPQPDPQKIPQPQGQDNQLNNPTILTANRFGAPQNPQSNTIPRPKGPPPPRP